MSGPEMDEHELLQALKDEEPRAFENLVERYKGIVLNTCYRFVLNREDAQDIAQEVFIEILRSIPGFRGQARLSTWIYRVAVNKSLDHLRKMKRKKRFDKARNLLGLTAEVEKIPAPGDNEPLESLEMAERQKILQQALASLAENQRIAITLSKLEGFGNKDIAEIMATSLSSVEALIHRAKKNLRTKLRHYYEKRFEQEKAILPQVFLIFGV